ncbi:MAG TPA: AMP-binding protein [Hyphomicrobiaceae bacterium]|nr:AMP-binding protein [Hyphomicrobiaceae bacterium]
MQFQTVLKGALARRWRDAGEWRDESPFAILSAQAARHPDRIAFIDAEGRISYGELKDRVERCAAYLRRIGIAAGDVVTIQLPNRIAFPIAFFALELIGAVANKVNPDFRIRELDYILRFSGSKGFICPSHFKGFDYVGMARQLRAAMPALSHLVVSGEAVGDEFNLERGIAESAPLPASDRAPIGADDIFRMAFTSGTTGNPKCVLHSFNTTLPAVRQINRDMLVTEKDVQLVYLPVCLNWGYLCLLQAILSGSKAVLLERFSAKAALELIEREGVTYIATAPASIVAMLNEPNLSGYDVSSLRVVITGGASAAIETIRDYQARMPGHLIELYGMLETGFHTYTRFSDDAAKVNGTIGRVVSSMGLKILDEAGNEVPAAEVGEIAALGPSVHLGYHANAAANAEAFTADGWFRTGDLGRIVDRAGNVEIVGRRKEIINRGGKKFFPREVEELLYTHPKVMHAAMVGVADARLGERNCLCVIPKAGQAVTLGELVAHLKGQVADYKLPEELHIVDELPFTATGKLRRHVLTDMIAKGQVAARR